MAVKIFDVVYICKFMVILFFYVDYFGVIALNFYDHHDHDHFEMNELVTNIDFVPVAFRQLNSE